MAFDPETGCEYDPEFVAAIQAELDGLRADLVPRAPREFNCTFNYDSWSDNDLFRAIEADPTCAQDYLNELTARAHARAAQQELIERVNARYQIVPLSLVEKVKYWAGEIRARLGW